MTEIISYVPQGITEIKEFCNMVAKSNIVPKEYIGKPENVFVACIKGMDLGLKPLQALECIAVINGKTSLYGDAYLAIARGTGQLENYKEAVEGEGDKMKAIVTVKRRGEEANTSEYSASDAKTANLWGKSGPWSLHPKRMLIMKARNYALRAAFADKFLGMEYSAEELLEVEESKTSKVSKAPKDVTPVTHSAQEIVASVVASTKENVKLFMIDGKFLTGLEVKDAISDRINNIMSYGQLVEYEDWKAHNVDGIKEFCKMNKEIAISFAEDMEIIKKNLEEINE